MQHVTKEELTKVDFNQLSKWGLIYEINNQVLHPLGLALMRNIDGTSSGSYIDNSGDLEWEYQGDVIETNEKRLQYFLDNRVEILTKISKG